jgi:hypothetical protein
MKWKVDQVHHPWDLFSQPDGSFSGKMCLTLSSISHFLKLEMFAISARRWLQQGVEDIVPHGSQFSSRHQVRNKIVFSFFFYFID